MDVRTLCLFALIVAANSITAFANDAELDRFQGKWEVIELVEDGNVIPQNAIEDWLPSGGRLEIVDNAIISVSHHDQKKEVKIFSIDAAEYPKGVEIRSRDKREVWGIYRFDEDRLIICLVDHEDGSRPDSFSARAGSKRMLMTLRPVGRKVVADTRKPDKVETTDPPQKSSPTGDPPAAHQATDEEMTKLLQGTVWKYLDAQGALIISLSADGHFSTVRENTQMRLFQKVFVRTPISNGDWSIQKGKLWMHVRSSVDPTRVDTRLPFTLRVVTDKDLIFVDYVGHVAQAVKVK